MENNELKKLHSKNHACYYFNDIIEVETFDFDIVIDENSDENI